MAGFFRTAPRFRIVPANTAHIPEYAAIHADAFRRGWGSHEFAGLLRDPAITASAAVDSKSNAALGFIMSRRALDEAEILSIAVGRSVRRGGVGAALLSNHIADLSLQGVRTVFLEVDEANAPALALYARSGFNRVGERRGYYPTSSSAKATAIIMRRDI